MKRMRLSCYGPKPPAPIFYSGGATGVPIASRLATTTDKNKKHAWALWFLFGEAFSIPSPTALTLPHLLSLGLDHHESAVWGFSHRIRVH